ncbi:NADH-quinone oxidoreductase subunit N [Bdellovibrio sp. SKB1291214]|uniref:NADH-quinone oxidoreductase subunit N n=1 Tax=Bdellovibrio sp. SKB1291214 TaxID=1732569 RepID=UPI000B51BBD8|nr:NADH-quinone oxidoreductase subunit N [Bdellovibrio sp. SKB1291214]UYL10581.1 NADH-quinone oxidoreductase subunit N [Bdellovibrio sp. SKB1291214]
MNMNIGLSDILLVSPMIALFLASLVPITAKVLRGNREQNPIITLCQALIGIVIAVGLLVVFGGAGKTAFNNGLIFDGVTQWMGVIALFSAGAAMIMMYENPSTTGKQFSELIFLAMSSAVGMLILVSAVDLLMVFIGLEMMSLALYLMIAMSHEEKLSKEAALKYFILGSFASALFLYGVAFVFGTTGNTNILAFMENAAELIQSSRLFMFGITFVILGFCFKVSIAPFHAWTPDVYQGAPTPHSAFMATAVKTVSFAAFLRVIATRSLVGSEHLFDILQWLAVITMIIGNTAAILQNNLKRMLAYSSIAHSGYLLVGVITAGVSDDAAFGASGVIFYLLSYGLMTLGAFAIASMLEKSENHIINIDDLAGFAKQRPMMALCLTVFLLSLTGIPPTLGFFGKFYLFNAAIGEGLLWLAVWGMISSVISVYYYLRPIVVMYMRDGNADVAEHSLNATTVTVVVMALAIMCMGFMSGPLFAAVEKSLL